MFRKLHEFDSHCVTISLDGVSVVAEAGESVAALLLRQSEPWSRENPVSEQKRAPYCMMGVCFECLADIDGVGSVQTCMKTVCDGMRVTRKTGKREIGS